MLCRPFYKISIFVLILALYALVISDFGNRFFSEALLGSAYDSLAKHLLDFSAEVDLEAIGWEASIVNNKYYMYFGAFPALLRIPLNFFLPHLYGQWSRLSCLLSAILSLWALIKILDLTLETNDSLTKKNKQFILCSFFLTFALGSPYLHLFASAQIYHESILWALAFSYAALYFLLKILISHNCFTQPDLTKAININWSWFDYACYSTCVGAAVMSRVTYGIPHCLILAFVLPTLFWLKACKSRAPKQILKNFGLICLYSLPIFIIALFQCWYNFARFESPFVFADSSKYMHWHTMAHLHPNGSCFDLRYLPDTLWNYLLKLDGYLVPVFPFVRHTMAVTSNKQFYNPGYLQPIMSLIIASPLLLCAGFFGIYSAIKKRLTTMLFVLFFLVVQCWIILVYAFIVQRYILEFFPFLLLTNCLAISNYKRSTNKKLDQYLNLTLITLTCWSIVVNTLSTYSWMLSNLPALK